MTTIFTTDSGDEYMPETPEPGTPEFVPGTPFDQEDIASAAITPRKIIDFEQPPPVFWEDLILAFSQD